MDNPVYHMMIANYAEILRKKMGYEGRMQSYGQLSKFRPEEYDEYERIKHLDAFKISEMLSLGLAMDRAEIVADLVEANRKLTKGTFR